MRHSVPQLAESMLMALGADTEFRNDVLGDLAEEFDQRASYDVRSARRWYRREALRVAPYLLRNWWRLLRREDVKYFAGVLARTSVILIVFEVVMRVVFLTVAVSLATPRITLAAALVLLSVKGIWTMIGGVFGGYVATRLDRRAPLTSALLIAVTWSVVILLRAPGLLLIQIFCALLMVAGVLAGSVLGVQRLARRLPRGTA
ncbi:MAG: hypothetical protein ACREMA_08080 [Longimicrobiales bacterium]